MTPWVAAAARPGSSRGHQRASTSRQGSSVSWSRKYRSQSATRFTAPSASRQVWSVMRSLGSGPGVQPPEIPVKPALDRVGAAEPDQGLRRHRAMVGQAAAELGSGGREPAQPLVQRLIV